MRAGRTPRGRARAPVGCRRARRARPRSSSGSLLAETCRAAALPRCRRRREASSWRITRSGRNSSRCRRRIVSQPLDVVLAEEPVAARRALRRQQALVLEVADLRDRDVRELGAAARADRADRVQALLLGLTALCGCGGHRLEEREPVLADLDLVVVLELGRLDPAAVDEGAVEAAVVLDREGLPVAQRARRGGARR